MKKAIFITNIPAHYRVALIRRAYSELLRNGINLITIFSRRNYKRRNYWDINPDKFEFDYIVLDKGNSFILNNTIYELGFSIIKILDSIKPGIIISAGFSMKSLIVSSYCRSRNIPLLIYSGETNSTFNSLSFNSLRNLLRSKINKNTTGYLVYGSKAREYIETNFGAERKPIYEIINTVDTEKFDERLNACPISNKDKYRVLFVGDLKSHKGVDLLIRAMAGLSKSASAKCELVIVGSGDLLTDLKTQAENAGLQNIVFEGKVNYDEIASFYKNSDLFILPSIFEHFGLVLVEAAIAGKAILASKYCGGAYDIIEAGMNGYIIDPYDTADFSSKIEELIQSSEKTKLFGKKSRDIISQRVNINIAKDSFCKSIIDNIV